VLIRREAAGDAAAIRAVTAAAFFSADKSVEPAEAALVDDLRACSAWLAPLSLGSPAYYSRFGFRLSEEYQITPPESRWRPHFQVRVLTAYQPGLRGAFAYPEPFDRML
jgi:predicted N-acetyltransferase YhbS